MCQLLGVSSNENRDISNLLNVFYARGEKCPDGWGLATYILQDNQISKKVQIIKQPFASNCCEVAKQLVMQPVITCMSIAHIRKATLGNIHMNNTHPFTTDLNYNKKDGICNKTLVFAHNGYISNGIKTKANKTIVKTKGQTDSEKIMLCIKSYINSIEKYSAKRLYKAIEESLSYISSTGKVNLLFSDGDKLFAFSNKPQTLYMTYNKKEKYWIICTQPIQLSQKTEWVQMPLNKLHVFKAGELIYKSENSVINDIQQLTFNNFLARNTFESNFAKSVKIANFLETCDSSFYNDSYDDNYDYYNHERDLNDKFYDYDYDYDCEFGTLLLDEEYECLAHEVKMGTATIAEKETYEYNTMARAEIDRRKDSRRYYY